MFGWNKKEKKSEENKSNVAVASKPAAPPKESKGSDLKISVKDRKACEVTLSIQVSPKKVEEEIEHSFKKLQGQAKVPGFRQGKVPLDVVKKNYAGSAREHALDHLLRDSVRTALEKENIEPVATPAIDGISYDENKPLKFDVKVECAPEVKLKGYDSLNLTKKIQKVTDKEIEKKLEEMRESNSRLVVTKEETVGDKHFVVVDYEGFLEGEPIEGGKAEGQLIDMSAPQGIAGFTEGVKGGKVGDVKDVEVTFPQEHPSKKIAGKPVNFKITIKDIKEKSLPALDDDFAKDLGCQDLADLKKKLKENLEAEAQQKARKELEIQVTEKLLESHPFEVPPTLLKERAEHLTQHLKQYLMQQGGKEEDWKQNEEKMAEKNQLEAEKQVRLSYILSSIAKKAEISISEEDVKAVREKSLAKAGPAQRKEMEKWLETRSEQIQSQLFEEKIFNWIIDHAKVEEKEISN